ncbi:MAG: OmpH family outer membrane protein [Gammaproteobacteria bacterium]|nr:OmpH family outer membrane protein [Gammaproteobacteria bacterium]MDE2345140.1 OmpH family outer membrane protein [Gammaproteobacteria bacterium]
MRHVFITASLLAAGFLAISTTQAANAPRIATVNLQQVLSDSTAGQDAQKDMVALRNKLQGQANDKEQKLKVLQDQIKTADSKSKDYATLQKSFQDSRNEYQQFVMLGQQELEAQRQQLLQPIEQEMMRVIDAYGRAHHYDFILSRGAAGAIFAASNYDITDAVTKALNADWAKMKKAQAAKGGQKSPPGGGQ